ncbi:hypothetical protein [Hymenobacter sp. PAMC 26628]|nr:hypothetical protein [Hymenobacter sp. PAMC 26628]
MRQHLAPHRLPKRLAVAAHAGSKDLRACTAHGRCGPAVQA